MNGGGTQRRVAAHLIVAILAAGAVAGAAHGQAETPGADDDRFAVEGQTTVTEQAHPAFASPFQGPNSLGGVANGRETWDATLFLGSRLWKGAEVWIDPEIDQGFGLSDTLGVAGFPSAEAYKVGREDPYFRLQRFFLRDTVDLGGGRQKTDADQNQFAEDATADRLVLTVGKFGVTDIFDANSYAHNSRGDFLNWSVIDAGTFDYAADAWGYSLGAAAELYEGRWTFRAGSFLLSNVPNSPYIDTRFDQFQLLAEVEERHQLFGQAGKAVVTAFLSRGRMGTYANAIALADTEGGAPNTALVRRYAGRPGVSLDLEQKLTGDLAAFARAGWADGRYEAYEFTDIDRALSGGLSLAGDRWGRAKDTLGLAGAVNMASGDLKRYLADGGLGILIGDGRLPSAGAERIVEAYYSVFVVKSAQVSFDYQWIVNPGYDRDRGPASVFAIRLHGQF